MNTVQAHVESNVINMIDQRAYEAGWEAGYNDGLEGGFENGYRAGIKEAQKRAIERRKKREAEQKEAVYFLKQRLVGMLVLLLTIGGVAFSDGDATFALLMLPLALWLICSKERILMIPERRKVP